MMTLVPLPRSGLRIPQQQTVPSHMRAMEMQIARGHALDAGQADVDPGVRIPLTAALPNWLLPQAKTLPSSLRAST